jgi:hypothetical protein
MKNFFISLLVLFFAEFQLYGQDWNPFNDSLVYFYQASNTGNYFTLRTKTKTISGDETKIHFVDNYIPCDTLFPDGYQLFYAKNGSILGDSMVVVADTIWLENGVRFENNMTLGETLPFSLIDGTSITYSGISDTLIFDLPDSVRYYTISDGTELIQSKNFGIIHFPKQNSDLFISYKLVGIENSVGLNFDHHNEIFDFEVGDKFFYRNSYYSVFYEIWDSYNSKMTVLDKYEIDGKFYYNVYIDGEYISNYPATVFGNTAYDYPGEQVKYCRGCDGISNTAFEYVLGDDNEYLVNVGHNYITSPEIEENVLQVVGFGAIEDGYTTFNSSEGFGTSPLPSLHFDYYPYDQDQLLGIFSSDAYSIIYEEGFGLVFLNATNFESGHYRELSGAIKSGDTLGIINLDIEEEKMQDLNLFPNPASDILNFDQPLSDIKITDVSGKQVLFVGTTSNQINISDLEAGTYYISGVTLVGDLRTKRFIVM